MYDPNDDRRKQLYGVMQNSIAPLPEAPQFTPMQPMEVGLMQDQGPSPVAQVSGVLASLINKKRKQADADVEDYE